MIYSKKTNTRKGVGVIFDAEVKEKVVGVIRKSNRIIMIYIYI